MKAQDLQRFIVVCHTKHNRKYYVQSDNARMKTYDPEKKEMVWVDAVIYVPFYENEYDCFCREKESFLAEFELVGD